MPIRSKKYLLFLYSGQPKARKTLEKMAWVKKLLPVDLPKAFSDKGYKYSLKIKVSVTQSCPTLCDPKDCSPPGSSVHGIVQARILEWFAIPFSRGSSWPRDQTWVFYNAGIFLTTEPSLVAIILAIGNFSESWGIFRMLYELVPITFWKMCNIFSLTFYIDFVHSQKTILPFNCNIFGKNWSNSWK